MLIPALMDDFEELKFRGSNCSGNRKELTF